MAATPLLRLLLLAVAVTNGLCVEVSNKLDLWEDENDNEVEPRPPPQTVVDVHVVVGNGSASAGEEHPDVPVFVPVELVTRRPAASRPWRPQGGYAPTSTVSVPDVPVYVPVANSVYGDGSASGHKVHYDDVPILIGSSGVKHVKPGGSDKTVPVVIPISINISTGKEGKAPPPKDVPVIVGKPPTNIHTVPPDVPVVYGLNLGPQFHRRGGGALVRPAPPLSDRTFWWPPGVALAPRPWLPPLQLPHYRPPPHHPTPRPVPVTPGRNTRTTTTTTVSSLLVDGKLDFDDA